MATDYTADPWYDIRKLRAGGWKASKIKVEGNGQWSRFIDSETNSYINKTQRIDYTKKYNPPKRRATAQREQMNRDQAVDRMFFTALETHRSKVFPEIAHLELTPGILCTNQTARTARPQTAVQKTAPERKSRIVELDLSAVPQTARIVKKRKGDTECGCPFRVSSALATTPRQKRGNRAKSEMIVTGRKSCLET